MKNVTRARRIILISVLPIILTVGIAHTALSTVAYAQTLPGPIFSSHSVRMVPTGWMRRIVVFPFAGPQELRSELDQDWNKTREMLTEPRRFLIGSRKFLVEKDAFLPRRTLAAADVVLLGRLLDTDVVMTGEFADRKAVLRAYAASDGSKLWQNEYELKTSAPVRSQMENAFGRLTADFLSRIPYQGFVTIDPAIGTVEYDEGDVHLMKVEVGTASLQSGDSVQWIRIDRTTADPLFQEGSKVTVVGDGQVISTLGTVVTVELKRKRAGTVISENDFVTFPRVRDEMEASRLAHHQDILSKGIPEWVQAEIRPQLEMPSKSKSLATSLIAIGNAVAIILLVL